MKAVGDLVQARWEVHKVMRGAMGVVFVVYDKRLKEVLAAKTYQDKAELNPSIAAAFTREALAWINLDAHQNVTQAAFVENIEGKPYLFMEYVSGGDLSGWIGTPRLIKDPAQVLRFAIQICDGIVHFVSKGIQSRRDI